MDKKQLLVFGAGKSATVLIDYLKNICAEKNWFCTVCDANKPMVEAKIGDSKCMRAVSINIELDNALQTLIAEAAIVISLLPPALHLVVAKACISAGKNLLTASYIDDNMRRLAEDIHQKKLLFIGEMGLDPGIDHMSAMEIIHRIKKDGGNISRFRSHCGGLIAPESDTNSWHYKISWNPRNIVTAGSAGAVFKENNHTIHIPYQQIFNNAKTVAIPNLGEMAFYPNRDSLSYIPIYKLESTETFIRTTLRHPAFCNGWQKIIEAGLTSDAIAFNSNEKTIGNFLFDAFTQQKISIDSPDLKKQLDELGWNDDTKLHKGVLTNAQVLQHLLETKWKLQAGDKDMIVMLHEIDYEIDGLKRAVTSSLIVKGEDEARTAMAKTVGLPLGIAATLILEEKIQLTGLHIPILPEIYEPVLEALKKFGIAFETTIDDRR